MASYKTRLEKDLDRWIAEGLVPLASREPILAGVLEVKRPDAATAFAVVGGILAGVAAIAFVAANWNAIPRLPRFGLILAIFLGVCAVAAWAARAARPVLQNTLLAVAALVFAAAIGLTGQIFDIAGDPQSALRGAGLAALLLALAGRSSGAALLALVFLGLSDFQSRAWQGDSLPWLVPAAPVGVALAWFWRSKPLAHVAAPALGFAALRLLTDAGAPHAATLFAAAAGFALLAAGARALADRNEASAPTLHGWFVLAALAFLGAAGLGDHGPPVILHRGVWLLASGGVVALGLHDRRSLVTAIGVLSLIGAGCAILFDLGLGLMSAAAVFAVVALLALAAGWALRRRAKP
jgi:uncharacterized membrane protein